jgi:flagellar motor switch protein FliG
LADQESEHGSARRRNSANLSGVRKAAILLVAVGEELAKEILRALPEVDVQRLTEELADLKGITPELSGEVLEEFWELLETQGFVMHGGLDYASRLLMETFGKERADDLLMLVRRSQEAAQGNLAKLQRTDPQQLGKLLDAEHPQTIALVLAHLDPRRASLVLDNLSEEHKVVSIQRLAEMRQFSPEMAQKVAHILHRRLEHGRYGSQELLRFQGSGRSAQPRECRRVQEDPRDHRRRCAGTGPEHSQPDVHL